MQKKKNNETINRDDVIKYALKNQKSIDELQQMLTENGFRELYARLYRDCVFIWAIYHKKDLGTVNAELEKINCRRI